MGIDKVSQEEHFFKVFTNYYYLQIVNFLEKLQTESKN